MNYKKWLRIKLPSHYWLVEVSIGTVATILGIVLTLGVSALQERKAQRLMMERITKVSFHNIDVRLSKLEYVRKRLTRQDSVYRELIDMPLETQRLFPDTEIFSMIMLLFEFDNVMIDKKSEEIFANSFQVWQYLDNERVLTRLSLSYSMIDAVENMVEDCEASLKEIRYEVNSYILKSGGELDKYAAIKMVQEHAKMLVLYEKIHLVVETINPLLQQCRQLNDLNIEDMGYTKEEVDRLGGSKAMNVEYKGWPDRN